MTTAPPEPMADTRDIYAVHTMFRREFGLAPGLVRGVAEGDRQRAETVGAHIDLLCRILHAHHDGEDLYLWPLLQQRAGQDAQDVVGTMESQHKGLEAGLERVNSLLPAWRASGQGGAKLADALDDLLGGLLEHMAMEEQFILPLCEKYITASEFKQLGDHGRELFSKRELPLAFGLVMYEAEADVVKAVLADAPLAARLPAPVIAPRRFAAHSKQVHGTPTPPRAASLS